MDDKEKAAIAKFDLLRHKAEVTSLLASGIRGWEVSLEVCSREFEACPEEEIEGIAQSIIEYSSRGSIQSDDYRPHRSWMPFLSKPFNAHGKVEASADGTDMPRMLALQHWPTQGLTESYATYDGCDIIDRVVTPLDPIAIRQLWGFDHKLILRAISYSRSMYNFGLVTDAYEDDGSEPIYIFDLIYHEGEVRIAGRSVRPTNMEDDVLIGRAFSGMAPLKKVLGATIERKSPPLPPK